MISKILVANRGEIARRVFRTCREMGIATVAVYSEPDAQAPFVLEADESVPLKGATATETYLDADAVVAAAKLAEADAIHPGYGFLSENAEFARKCTAANIVFIGPTAEVIELMGSKLGARALMEDAGVAVLPGKDLTGLKDEEIARAADSIGWPILVKASYGGGGRGMRVVRDPAELLESVRSAHREATSAFGDGTVFLEHYVDEPRHIEIQIFGDKSGNIVHLNERECSIQRRHQKIIEESPSPAVTPELRTRMGAAAVTAGKALGYLGAGTVEFLLAPTGEFYFLEVNTRLQVEHPVTELVTGLDLVRLQIEVEQGAMLSERVQTVSIHGHAIEARLYAEDTLANFLPSAGTLTKFEIPDDAGIRIDSGVAAGDVISTNYDPMLAKVISFAATRDEAVNRLARTLRRTRIHGVTTNRALLVGILEELDFREGRIDTHFLERKSPADLQASAESSQAYAVAALSAALASQAASRRDSRILPDLPSGFRNHFSALQTRDFVAGDQELSVGYRLGRDSQFEVNGEKLNARLIRATPDEVELVVGGVRTLFHVSATGHTVHVDSAQASVPLQRRPRFPDPEVLLEPGSLIAPMPGTVVRVAVAAGEHVTAGKTVLVIEAMKMEHSVASPIDGVVGSLEVAVGQTVDAGQLLVVLQELDEEPV